MKFFKENLSPAIRNILLITSYVLLTGLFFTVGYTAGYHNGGGMLSTSATVETEKKEPTPQPSPSLTPEQYRVVLEDNELRLYKDDGGVSRVISHEQISENSFPTHDVETLRQGCVFTTLEEAISLMENFLS